MIALLVLACSSSPTADPWFHQVGRGIPVEAKSMDFALAESGEHLDVWVVIDGKWAFRTDEDGIPAMSTPDEVRRAKGNEQVRAAGDWLATHLTAAEAAALLQSHDALDVRVLDEGTAWVGWSGTLTADGLTGTRTPAVGERSRRAP